MRRKKVIYRHMLGVLLVGVPQITDPTIPTSRMCHYLSCVSVQLHT